MQYTYARKEATGTAHNVVVLWEQSLQLQSRFLRALITFCRLQQLAVLWNDETCRRVAQRGLDTCWYAFHLLLCVFEMLLWRLSVARPICGWKQVVCSGAALSKHDHCPWSATQK